MNFFHATGWALSSVVLIPLLAVLLKRFLKHRRIERQKNSLRGSWE